MIQRDGKAYIRDFGSTNGTFVNDEPVKDEVELHNNDQLKIGPLLFQVLIVQEAPAMKGATPKPPTKAVGDKAIRRPAAKGPPKTPPPSKAPAATKTSVDLADEGGSADDDIAAMLLSLHDEDGPSSSGADSVVPEGSTVMELIVPPGVDDPSKAADKTKDKDKAKATGNTSTAAKSILEQYMKRAARLTQELVIFPATEIDLWRPAAVH